MEIMSERAVTFTTNESSLHQIVDRIEHRILQEGNKPHVSVVKQLKVLYELTQFEFGRHLLTQQGSKSFWCHYLLTYPWYSKKTGLNSEGQPFTDLEKFILEDSPSFFASQERFFIFLDLAQKFVKNSAKLASMPCGLMGELLYLDYSGISQIELTGIDASGESIKLAKKLAQEQKLLQWCNFKEQEYDHLVLAAQFDLLVSYSFNMYESDPTRLLRFYKKAYEALKPGGTLLACFLTHPPGSSEESEWDLVHLDKEALSYQRIIFSDVLQVKWNCYQTSEQFKACLKQAGFKNIQFVYDHARIYPTVIAQR